MKKHLDCVLDNQCSVHTSYSLWNLVQGFWQQFMTVFNDHLLKSQNSVLRLSCWEHVQMIYLFHVVLTSQHWTKLRNGFWILRDLASKKVIWLLKVTFMAQCKKTSFLNVEFSYQIMGILNNQLRKNYVVEVPSNILPPMIIIPLKILS